MQNLHMQSAMLEELPEAAAGLHCEHGRKHAQSHKTLVDGTAETWGDADPTPTPHPKVYVHFHPFLVKLWVGKEKPSILPQMLSGLTPNNNDDLILRVGTVKLFLQWPHNWHTEDSLRTHPFNLDGKAVQRLGTHAWNFHLGWLLWPWPHHHPWLSG